MRSTNLDLRDTIADVNTTCGNTMILCEITPEREFVNGKPTANIANHIYNVVLPDRGYRHLWVKIPGPARLALDSSHQHDVSVEFQGLEIKPYAFLNRNGNLVTGVSAKASGIKVVNTDSARGLGQKG